MSISHASPVEIVWTVVNLFTLLLTAHLLREAHLDLRAVRAAGKKGLILRVAAGSRRRQIFKVTIAGSFTLAGLYAALFVPPYLTGSGAPVAVALLIFADFALAALAIENARERHFAMEFLDRWHPETH